MKKAVVAVLVALMIAVTGAVPAHAAQQVPPKSVAAPTIVPALLGVGKGVMWLATAVGAVDAIGQIIRPDHNETHARRMGEQNAQARDVPTRGRTPGRNGVIPRTGAGRALQFGFQGIMTATSYLGWGLGGEDVGKVAAPIPGGKHMNGWARHMHEFRSQGNRSYYPDHLMISMQVETYRYHENWSGITMQATFRVRCQEGKDPAACERAIESGYDNPRLLAKCSGNGNSQAVGIKDARNGPVEGRSGWSTPASFDHGGGEWTWSGEFSFDCGHSTYVGGVLQAFAAVGRLAASGSESSNAGWMNDDYTDAGHPYLPPTHGGEGRAILWPTPQHGIQPPDPVEQGGVTHRLVTEAQCQRTDGTTFTLEKASEWFEVPSNAGEDWSSPEAPQVDCPTGSFLIEANPTIETSNGNEVEAAPIYQEPVVQSDIGREAGQELANGRELPDLVVEVQLSSGQWVRCDSQAAGELCRDWDYHRQTKPETYRCMSGGSAVAMSNCSILARWYNPSPALTPPTPPNPSAPPVPGGSDEARECFPNGWGMLNPVEWVVKPLKCAFIPDPTAVQDMWSTLQAEMMAKPPWSIASGIARLVPALTESFTVASECSWQPNFGSGLELPCDPEREIGWAFTMLYRLAQVAIVGGGILLIARLIRSEMKKWG